MKKHKILSSAALISALLTASLGASANVGDIHGAQCIFNGNGSQCIATANDKQLPTIQFRTQSNLKAGSQFIIYCKQTAPSNDLIFYFSPEFITTSYSWFWGKLEIYTKSPVPSNYNNNYIGEASSTQPFTEVCTFYQE